MAITIRREERYKWIAGGALLALAALLLYRSLFVTSGPPKTTAPSAGQRATPFSAVETAPGAQRPRLPAGRGRRTESAPPAGVFDPALRVDLLAKAPSVTYAGNGRNIFQYHTPPPAPPPKPVSSGVVPGKKEPSGPPPKPPAPPIPLKYYGYAQKSTENTKRAFFVDGEEIYIAGEGEIVNKRYRVLKIGVNTVEVEDLITKNRQTLPLQEG